MEADKRGSITRNKAMSPVATIRGALKDWTGDFGGVFMGDQMINKSDYYTAVQHKRLLILR